MPSPISATTDGRSSSPAAGRGATGSRWSARKRSTRSTTAARISSAGGAVEGRPSPLPRCQKKRKTRNRDAKKHRNGVVRKVLPRGSAFDVILDGEMRRIDRMLSDRPLKCRNWRTPREAFTALLHRHLLAAA